MLAGIYAYHFYGREKLPKLRKINDEPLHEHIYGWKAALVRPEGISAVICYMFIGGKV